MRGGDARISERKPRARAGAAAAVRAALLLALAASLSPARAEEPRFEARLEVRRILLEVRVVDGRGRPLPGLAAADFRVRVGGQGVAVESAEWVDDSGAATVPAPAPGPAEAEPVLATEPPMAAGRTVVLLFQTDLIPSRLTGIHRMARRSRRWVERLAPGDRVAVAVLGTHLRLHADLTDDVGLLRRELDVPQLLGWHELERPSGVRLDVRRARDADTLPESLHLLAEALAPLPGPKTLLLFAWGLGTWDGLRVHLGRDYPGAVEALLAAGVTVHAADVTDASFHTLEVGLQAVARDTGGLYAKTHEFPDAVMDRLEGLLAGRYRLALVPPSLPPGDHALEVTTAAPGAVVHARPLLRLAP